MVYLPTIGFGLLVISIRLIFLWRNLKGTAHLLTEGLIIVAIGLFAWVLATFVSGDTVLRTTGYSIMFIGLITLVQWVMQSGRDTLNKLHFWALSTAIVGGLLIIVFYIWTWLFTSGH